jgi:DNA polymerase IV
MSDCSIQHDETHKRSMRRILHMDMDAFFAAVERRRHPELVGKSLVIGGRGDPAKRGVVSTASYEARVFGIHSAMPLRTARKLCPEAVFLPVDHREYSRVSKQVKIILKEFSPIMEDGGIDEAYLDITLSEQSSEAIARCIKNKIRSSLGLTCSIGIAPNKLLAKIASDLEKPDGLTILKPADLPLCIWPLPAGKLWGVGPKTEEHLERMGIHTVGEITSLGLDVLVREFGDSHGKFLHRASRGIDERPLVTHWVPKSSSRETTFEHDTVNRQIITETLLEQAREVAEEIRKGGLKAKNVTVKVRFNNFETYTRGMTLKEATDEISVIRNAAMLSLKRFDLRRPVRLIGIRLGGLRGASDEATVPSASFPLQLRF